MNLATLKREAAKYGATVEDFNPDNWDCDLTVTAPDGMQWVESGSVNMTTLYFPYEKGSKAEAVADLIKRMGEGLEPYTE